MVKAQELLPIGLGYWYISYFSSDMPFLFVVIDCWHSVPILPFQTHCSYDAL